MVVPSSRSPRRSRVALAALLLLQLHLVTLLAAPASVSAATSADPSASSSGTPPASGTPKAGPEVSVARDVPYGSATDVELVLDVFTARDAVAAPVVMLIHGGGWTVGDKEMFEPESRALARAGFVVFDINYTLDPAGGPAYPRQVNDVHTALAWVQEHAAEYGGDSTRIGVLGGSAGGYLAAMLGTQANTASASPVSAVASLSGPMDITALVAGLRAATVNPDGTCAPVSCDVLANGRAMLETLLGCDPLECPPELLAEASPTTYVSEYSPPFFLANSTEENVPTEQATAMADLLRAMGVPTQLELVAGDRHSVAYLPRILLPLRNFLQTHVTVQRSPTPTTSATSTEEPTVREPARAPKFPLRAFLIAAVVLGLLGALFMILRGRRTTSRD